MASNTLFIDHLIPFYENTLKPLIEKREYAQVHSLLESSILYLKLNAGDVLFSAPHALNIASQLLGLYKDTAGGTAPCIGRERSLETFISQYRLKQSSLDRQ